MTRDNGAELASGVPARSEDSYRDSMHKECILLQRLEVNWYVPEGAARR